MERNKMSKKYLDEKAIALVPLIIIIIIVFTLAVATISLVMNENGREKAEDTKNDINNQQVEENKEIISEEITGEDGEFKYVKLENGKIQITRYIGTKTEIVIPATYDGYTVYSVGNIEATIGLKYNIFGETNSKNNTTVTSITISEGIEEIGTTAFSGCAGLTGTLILPESLKKIGIGAFNGCIGLTGDLVIPEGVTELGEGAFFYCIGFNGTLKIPSTITTIEGFAFSSCVGLTGDLIIPEGVTTIGKYAFQLCKGFNGKLILPSTLLEIGDGAFNHCSGLSNTSITIPKSVKTIGENATDGSHVFYNVATMTLTEFVVEEGNEEFKTIDGVLFNKEGTRLIAYPASRIGNTYEIPEGVTIIDELAFSRAGSSFTSEPEKGLKKIILPNSYILTLDLPDNYLNEGSNLALALHSYTGVEEVEVKEDNPNYKSIDGIVYSKDGAILWYVPFMKTDDIIIPEGVTTIKESAFYGKKRSQNIVIPASVINIEELSLPKKIRNSKITFHENCIYQFDENGNILKK